jgi:hypothetical protein
MQEDVIDGHHYRVTPLGARQGMHVARRLIKVLAPLASGADASLAQLDAGAISSMAKAMDDKDLDFVTDAMARSTDLSGDGEQWTTLHRVFDTHFSGEYGALARWLGFALRVNYPDFFSASVPSTTTPGA